jgi:hypothetical protein
MDIDHAAPGESSITLTISSDPSASDGSGGSVNGAFMMPPNNPQIGLALMPNNQGDPGFVSREGAIAWRKFFNPSSASDCHSTISVPVDWVEFLMCKLMTPEDFKWASSLMQSKVWDIITRNSDHETMKFLLPSSCPASSPPVCAIQQACKEVMTGFSTPQAPRKSSKTCVPPSTSRIHFNKRKRSPMVISEVRRSDRIQAQSKGYRRKTCFDRNCLACAPPFPGLKSNVVKNLYSKFGLKDKDKDVVAEDDGGVSSSNEEDSVSDDSAE